MLYDTEFWVIKKQQVYKMNLVEIKILKVDYQKYKAIQDFAKCESLFKDRGDSY